MATLVNTPSGLMWTGNIPDLKVSVADHVRLAVVVDDETVLMVMLYAYDGYANLVELTDIVEQHMLDTEAFQSTVKIYEVDDDDDTQRTLLCQFDAIYSLVALSNSCAEFCRQNFLSLAKIKRLEDGFNETLCYYDPDNASSTLKMQVSYLDDDNMRVAMVDDASSLVNDGVISFSLADVMSLASVDNVSMVTLTLGARQMLYFTSPIASTLAFSFRNNFNAIETLLINCIVQRNQEGERTLSKVQRKSVLSAIYHEVEFECETAPLARDEAILVEQMCESNNVMILPSGERVLIAKRTSEIGNERGTMPIVKFTYKYLDARQHDTVLHRADRGIFTSQFDQTYD